MLNFKIGPLLRQEKDLGLYNNEIKRRTVNDWLDFFVLYFKTRRNFYYGEKISSMI